MRKSSVLSIALIFALALTASAQDFDTAKKEFRQAVISMSPSQVENSAGDLIKLDSKAAVDVLLDGYGICAQQIKALWVEKMKWKSEMDRNSNFRVNYNTNPPTVVSGDVVKYKKYQEAQTKVQEVESKIIDIERVKRKIVEALGQFSSSDAVEQLKSKLSRDSDWTRRAGVAEALGEISDPSATPALVERLPAEREPGAKVAILEALKKKKPTDENAVRTIGEVIGDKYWQVQVTVCECLKAIGKDAVPAAEFLIEALLKADGRLKKELNDALIAITGVDKHGDHAAWKAWWDTNHAKVKAGKYTPSPGERAGKEGKGTTFYGIPVDSKRVVFILDRSGSMAFPSDWKLPEREDTASGGGGADKGPDVKKQGDRKIDIARWQLKLALRGMPDGAQFNIIFFNHTIDNSSIFKPKGMVKLSKSSRKAAYEFIDKLDPVGGTNIYDPVEKALSWASAGKMGEKLAKMGVDTIFLLTDGMPNSGQVPVASDIEDKLREMNRLKKVKINTIGVFTNNGGGANSPQPNEKEDGTKFLKKIAEDSGGQFSGPPK